ncbi:MAG: GFA family protein [Alphaproteobacteria bacterium]|nr:GFA family protein [Alphaproteobacteria bacterium]
MTSGKTLSGRCLCGAVTFTAEPRALHMDSCHCSMCRRWSAGPLFAVDVGTSLKIADGAKLGVYGSSDWAERCFCSVCGSTLFWRMRDGSFTGVSAQAFDDPGIFEFTTEIFVDEKPANYAFAGERKRMTGAEVLAAFSKQSE